MQLNKNTKFNIEDKVFYMNNNKPQCGVVTSIVLQVLKDDKDNVNYGIIPEDKDRKEGDMVMAIYVPEPAVFKTKDELLKSL